MNKKNIFLNTCFIFLFSSLIDASQKPSSLKKKNNRRYVTPQTPPLHSQEYLHIMNHAERAPLTLPQDLYDALYQAQQEGAEQSSTLCLMALIKIMPRHAHELQQIKIMEQFITK